MHEFDLTDEKDVVELMESSSTLQEWAANCDSVKRANDGGYPSFWYNAIILSNVAERTANKWGGDAQLRFSAIG